MNKKFKAALSLLCAVALLVTSIAAVNAAGSKNLYNTDTSYRMYSEWANNTTAGIDRKQVVYVYAFEGETVYYGSSVTNSKVDIDGTTVKSTETGYDIVITAPDGTVLNTLNKDLGDVISGSSGHIRNVTMEKAGPNIDGTNTNGYTPLSFTAEKSGVYEFHFQSVTATAVSADGSNPKPPVMASGTFNQQNSCIAAWDITIADTNKEIKSGRAFANYLSLNTGGNGVSSYTDLYVLTDDSYIYKVDLNGIDPYGFIFFANSRGLCSVELDSAPIYHSVACGENNMSDLKTTCRVDYKSPNSNDTALDKTYKIFFEEPSTELKDILYSEPEKPTPIKNLEFHGTISDNETYQGQGGNFTFDIQSGTSVTITMIFPIENKTNSPANTVTLSNAVTPGKNTFYWDGNFDDGTAVPVGEYSLKDIKITTSSKSGEIHFPWFDVESNNDINITRLNGPDTTSRTMVYYNNLPLPSSKINDTDTVTKSGDYYRLADGTYTYGVYNGYDKNINMQAGIDSNNSDILQFNTTGVILSGGNNAATDIWTYYQGDTLTQSFPIDSIIIKPQPSDTGVLSGLIFYDSDGEGGVYAKSNGDYGLTNIPVTITNANDGKTYTTTTNLNGAYYFYNLPFGTYTIAPTVNSTIYKNTTNNAPQTFSFTATGNAEEIGYYFDDSASKDIIVQKRWTNSIATESKVTIELFAQYTDSLNNTHEIDMNQSVTLNEGNSWKSEFNSLPTTIDGYPAFYFIKEYYTHNGENILIGKSQIIGDKENLTTSAAEGVNGTAYSATFSWNNLSPTQYMVTVTNTPPTDYKVTFHSNINGLADVYKIYATSSDSVYANEAENKNFLENDKTIAEFLDIPILPDDNSAYNNNSYIFAGWYYSDGTPLKWDTDKYLTYTDVYAHWVQVGNVAKDPQDTKITGLNLYSGFDLFGLQIRDEKYNPTDSNGNVIVNNSGLRFVTSYSEGLISNLEGLFTSPYNSNKKAYSDTSLRYGYVTSKTNTVDSYIAYNGLDKSTFKLTLENTKTLSSAADKTKVCAIDSDCTKTLTGTDVDHRNYGDYRISSLVIMYNKQNNDDAAIEAAKNTPVMARSYIRYTDANGIYRNAYNDYTGTQTYGGCSTSYKTVYNIVKGDTDHDITG